MIFKAFFNKLRNHLKYMGILLVKDFSGRHKISLTALLLGFLFSGFPIVALAQAGSSPPLVVEQTLAFSGDSSSHSGVARAQSRGPLVPGHILRVPHDQRYLLWIELRRGRLHLLEQLGNGSFTTVKVYPVSIGKNGYGKQMEGDKRTPVGVYHFTGFIDEGELLDFYGPGAYPINYPNAYDRRLRRTGHGIWLHGLPGAVSQRPYQDSDGCIVLDNESLKEMAQYIDTGRTHVVLTEENIQWRPLASVSQRSHDLARHFEEWRRAWERIDNDAYLAFYGEEFSDESRGKAEWEGYKREVNRQKSRIEIGVSELSFIAVPGAEDQVSVRYYQDYRSNNYNWRGWKEQLWRQTDEGWRIIYEGNG